ncbi:MAG: relaxase/mobilization nuclease domain-containing protein [Oscillospiraceae bacterium]|nr:relaxase/mobilization nuclease domain-containing protein [Oscillospiraceae bacterium]MCL2279634.1 relaxase/mobilization nuclease domain-containing protein [Oscillospiraceae bacterium]
MATTWIKPLHISKTKSKSTAISDIIDYVENPEKTDNGRLISAYCCNSKEADEIFLESKKRYYELTGRDQRQRDVIAYHVRQSFKPGEITPEEANEIGYRLAESLTKGNHAFVVCTHIDKAHFHNHIIFNSTSLDCQRKWRNFFFSNRAVRRISDLLCAEYGLTVIENPKSAKGKYNGWIDGTKKPTHQDAIKQKIDELLPQCSTFDDFINRLKTDGFTVNTKRQNISVIAPGWTKPARLNSLNGNYTEEAIRSTLGMTKTISGSSGSIVKSRVSLLIDIQAKIHEGKGAGYEQWAKIFNLKQAAKTLIYLQENGIDSYEDLKKKSSSASGEFSTLTAKIKEVESRQKEISQLQKHIAQYGKTRDVYAGYKASGWSRKYYDEHAEKIILNRASKKYFDSLNTKKLPTMISLKQEYATLAAEKKKLYSGYHELKKKSRELTTAKSNADRILGEHPDTQTIENPQLLKREVSHEK